MSALPLRIRRVLVALDASSASIAALDAAALLAARMQAELHGLFVEDADLLRLAGLPFASEFDPLSGGTRALAPPEMEQRLRAQAARAEERLVEVARRRQLRWSFRVARGRVSTELLSAGVEADVVALGASGASSMQRVRLGSTARAVIERAASTLLVLPHGAAVRSPVAVLLDASPASARTLEEAARLAEAVDGEVIALLCAADAALEERVRGALPGAGIRLRRLAGPDAESLLRGLREARAGTVVLGAGAAEGIAGALMECAEYAVLIVR